MLDENLVKKLIEAKDNILENFGEKIWDEKLDEYLTNGDFKVFENLEKLENSQIYKNTNNAKSEKIVSNSVNINLQNSQNLQNNPNLQIPNDENQGLKL